MPQIIEVPGQGQVEFPDGMTDDQIVAAIKANSAPAQPQPSPQPFTMPHNFQYNPEASRQLQLTARAAVKGINAIPNMLVDPFIGLYNRVTGSQVPSFSQRQDQALTDAGLAEPKDATERIVQSGASSLVPVGGLAKAAQYVPALAPLGQNLGWQAVSSLLGSTASQGAAEGGAGPGGQFAAGLLGGVAGPTALSAASAAGRAALRVPGSLIAPMTQAGRQNFVAKNFQTAATDPRMAAESIASAPQYVPGVNPNTAQLANDTGISALYKALVTKNGQAFADQEASNDAARQAFLAQRFGGPADVTAAQQARDAVTGPMREAAFNGAQPVDTAPVVAAGKQVLDAGAKYRGSGPILQKFVDNISEITDPQVLYNGPRKAINDALSGLAPKDSPLAQLTKSELIGLRGNIDDLIEQSAPGFKAYLATHADLSRPIDALKLGQQITSSATNPMTERLSPAQFARQMKNNAPEVAAAGPAASDALTRVNEDLKRSVAPLNVMRAPGSDTVQNLVGTGLLGSVLGRIPLGPLGAITGKVGSLVYSPFEAKTNDLMMNAMRDPNVGRAMLTRPIPQKPDLVAQFLSSHFPITYGGLLGAASGQQ